MTCKEPYEWKDMTEDEWEFSPSILSGNGAEPFKVSSPFKPCIAGRRVAIVQS